MKDDPSEFASVMNLILPLDKQFSVDKDFNKTYLNVDGTINREMATDISNKIKGRVSYLKAMTSEVRKIFIGRKIGKLKHFIVYPGFMSNFQSEIYLEAYKKDKNEKSIFINSRQASLFVFPNGTYGSEGFNEYIIRRKRIAGLQKKHETVTYTLSSQLILAINKDLTNLERFSHKFATTIRILNESPKHKALIYCEYVNGSGCILFAKILEQFGFTQAKGDERTRGRRYALITHQTTTQKSIQNIIHRFNKDDNLDGDYISVIIGSKIISEGFTLKNIKKEFIFTPHWNYSETTQVIARGWRLGSHSAILERGDQDVAVEIYQLVSLPEGYIKTSPDSISIDLEMYETSEKKDVAMKQIEYLIKLNTFDCPLMKDRNIIRGYDGMRECEYTNCDYECAGTIGPYPDILTYNLYYSLGNIVEEKFKRYFRTHFFLEISKLHDFFPYWMNPHQAVRNSLNFKGMAILTGYNMAGKSTTLRSSVVALVAGVQPSNELWTR